MPNWSQCPAVERVPEDGSSEWLFKSTRVPVKSLFENLKDGARVDDFLEQFPSITREQVAQVVAFLEDHVWLTGLPVGRELV